MYLTTLTKYNFSRKELFVAKDISFFFKIMQSSNFYKAVTLFVKVNSTSSSMSQQKLRTPMIIERNC